MKSKVGLLLTQLTLEPILVNTINTANREMYVITSIQTIMTITVNAVITAISAITATMAITSILFITATIVITTKKMTATAVYGRAESRNL